MSIKNLLASTLVFTANAACEFGTLTETLEGTAAPGSCCPGPARASGQGECSDSHPQMYTLTGFVCWTGEGNNVGRCTPPAAAAGAPQPTCEDAPNGWKSSTNAPCSTYQSRKWCTPEGGYGTGWMAGYGNFAKWAVNGVDGSQACCACGGGNTPTHDTAVTPPQDTPADPAADDLMPTDPEHPPSACDDSPSNWKSSTGAPCSQYSELQWCTLDGGYGSGWNPAYVDFAKWAVDGVDASQACCACGGGLKSAPVPDVKLNADGKPIAEKCKQRKNCPEGSADDCFNEIWCACNTHGSSNNKHNILTSEPGCGTAAKSPHCEWKENECKPSAAAHEVVPPVTFDAVQVDPCDQTGLCPNSQPCEPANFVRSSLTQPNPEATDVQERCCGTFSECHAPADPSGDASGGAGGAAQGGVQGGGLRPNTAGPGGMKSCAFTKYWENVAQSCDNNEMTGKACEYAKKCQGDAGGAAVSAPAAVADPEIDTEETCELVCWKDGCKATGTNPIGKYNRHNGLETSAWTVKEAKQTPNGCCALKTGACDSCCLAPAGASSSAAAPAAVAESVPAAPENMCKCTGNGNEIECSITGKRHCSSNQDCTGTVPLKFGDWGMCTPK